MDTAYSSWILPSTGLLECCNTTFTAKHSKYGQRKPTCSTVPTGPTYVSESSSAAAAPSLSRIALQSHADCPETDFYKSNKWLLIFLSLKVTVSLRRTNGAKNFARPLEPPPISMPVPHLRIHKSVPIYEPQIYWRLLLGACDLIHIFVYWEG